MIPKTFLLLTIAAVTALPTRADALTNSVLVTSNLTLFLHSSHHPVPQDRFKADDLIFYCLAEDPRLAANMTNFILYRALPFRQAFDFKLHDTRGREVAKTRKGKANSETPSLPKDRGELFKLKPQAVSHGSRELFRPEEMFLLKEKGVYDLELRIRIYAPTLTNDALDLEAMSNPYRFLTNRHFGIIISEPLHVKVIKE